MRRRNPARDRAGAIDSLIITIGLSLLSWVGADRAVPARRLAGDASPKLVSVAYPLGDILLLAAAIRLAVDAGRREPAFYLLTASIVALLVTDFAYGLITLAGDYTTRSGSTSAGSASTCCGAPPRCTRRCAASSSPRPTASRG